MMLREKINSLRSISYSPISCFDNEKVVFEAKLDILIYLVNLLEQEDYLEPGD